MMNSLQNDYVVGDLSLPVIEYKGKHIGITDKGCGLLFKNDGIVTIRIYTDKNIKFVKDVIDLMIACDVWHEPKGIENEQD